LRSAYRARPDVDGVSTFRTDEIRPARVPSVPRGHGVLTTGVWSPVAVAASQRQALPPALHPISRGGHHEASTRVSLELTRPVFPLPVAPVWSGCPWALPLMLRTPPLPATHVRVGTDHEHFSGAHRRLHPVPPVGELTRTVRPRVATTLCPGLWTSASVRLFRRENLGSVATLQGPRLRPHYVGTYDERLNLPVPSCRNIPHPAKLS